jgi:branched-chain amino acid transport system substrate-binding protein
MKRTTPATLISLVLALLLIVFAVAACGGAATTTTGAASDTTAGPDTTGGASTTAASTATSGTIKIGCLLDLTGGIAWGGLDAQKGLELAFEQAGYQVAGKKIELVEEDVASDSATTVDKVKKLVETDKVDLLVGPINGGGDNAILQYVEDHKIVRLELCPPQELAIAGLEWSFQPLGSTMMLAGAVADYAYDDLGYRTCVTMGCDIAGAMFQVYFNDEFKNKGGQVLKEFTYPMGTQNMLPYFADLPEADFFSSWWVGNDGLSGFPQYAESGLKMPIVQAEDGGTTASVEALKQIGKPAVGTVAGTIYSYLSPEPGNAEFVEAYKAKYNAAPGVFSGSGYAAGQVILALLAKTNGDVTPQVLHDTLRAINTHTIMGDVLFPSPDCNVSQHAVTIIKVSEDLQPEVIKTLIMREDHDAQGNPVLTRIK